MWPNLQETADLVTFTEEILNGKRHFLYIVYFHAFDGARKTRVRKKKVHIWSSIAFFHFLSKELANFIFHRKFL